MESRYFPCTGLKILERNTDIKMKKKNLKLLWMVMVVGALLGGCGGKERQPAAESPEKTTKSVQETASQSQ